MKNMFFVKIFFNWLIKCIIFEFCECVMLGEFVGDVLLILLYGVFIIFNKRNDGIINIEW